MPNPGIKGFPLQSGLKGNILLFLNIKIYRKRRTKNYKNYKEFCSFVKPKKEPQILYNQ